MVMAAIWKSRLQGYKFNCWNPFVLVKMSFSAVLNPLSLTLFSVTRAEPQSLEWSDCGSANKTALQNGHGNGHERVKSGKKQMSS